MVYRYTDHCQLLALVQFFLWFSPRSPWARKNHAFHPNKPSTFIQHYPSNNIILWSTTPRKFTLLKLQALTNDTRFDGVANRQDWCWEYWGDFQWLSLTSYSILLPPLRVLRNRLLPHWIYDSFMVALFSALEQTQNQMGLLLQNLKNQ